MSEKPYDLRLRAAFALTVGLHSAKVSRPLLLGTPVILGTSSEQTILSSCRRASHRSGFSATYAVFSRVRQVYPMFRLRWKAPFSVPLAPIDR